MSCRIVFAALFSIAALPAFRAAAAPSFFVSDFGTYDVRAMDTTAGIHFGAPSNYNSGQLQQLSISGGANTAADGTLSFAGTPHIEHADGSIIDTAQIGALHTLVKANATTDNFPYGNFNNASASADIHSTTSFFDTVTFRTTNPAGSDFTAFLTLDDDIENSATAQNGSDYSIGSSVTATLDITGLAVSHPTLFISDGKFLHGDGPINNPPASYVQSFTFHATNFTTLTFSETLNVRSTALGGNTGTIADASDTARFLLTTSDPAAFYTTASGVTFIPEPASLGLLAVGLVITTLRRR